MNKSRTLCPECKAACQHENCCECGAEMDPVTVIELEVCPKCGKNWEKHACRFCGCCGEFWKDCKHPNGPTEDWVEVLRRDSSG